MESNYPGCINKPLEYFQHKLVALSVQAKVMKSLTTVNECAVHASYVAFYEIAKKKMVHTIREKFILPVMKKVVNIMIRQKESAKLNSLSLSNNTVKR